MRPFQTLAFLAVLWLGTMPCQAQPDSKDKKAPKADTLEQMQAEALKNSHDIKVHDARMRLIQAQLDGIRAQLKAKVAHGRAEVDAAQAGYEEGKARYDRAVKLFDVKAISREDLDSAKLTMEKMQKEKLVFDSRLRRLLGRTAMETSEPLNKLVEKALRSNPDVKVAEARLLVTQAELERTRVDLATQVEIAVAEVEEARAALAEAENRFKRAKQIDISKEDLGFAKLTMLRCRSEKIAKEAQLQILVLGGATDLELTPTKPRDK